MPSFRFDAPWHWIVMWQAIGFAGALVANSFVEWFAHRFILHSKKIVGFAYELHDVSHHGMFGADETYHALDDHMRGHITFVLRDYVMFLLVTAPLWVGAELLIGRPVLFGGVLATLAGLQAFNSFHFRFHCPSDTWFQRTKFFQSLKEHHRIHHRDRTRNFNVFSFPLADILLGTRLKKDPGAPLEKLPPTPAPP